MTRQMFDAVDIEPGKRNWTVIVQVVERHPVMLTNPDNTYHRSYRNYLLTDMKETKVQAVIFDGNISFFEKSLLPFKRYKISNAFVSPAKPRYKVSNYDYCCFISNKTPVELIDEDKPPAILCTFDTINISDLYKYAETDEFISVKGWVIHAFPPIYHSETQTIKEYIIINEENIPVKLRLWKDLLNEYDNHTDIINKKPLLIIATNLKVNTYHGISLSGRKNTNIIQNPPLLDADNLPQWFSSEVAITPDWLRDNFYHNTKRFFPYPKDEEIVDVSTALSKLNQLKTTWVKGNIELVDNHRQMWYSACGHCSKMLDSPIDWILTCTSCKIRTTIEARTKLTVNLYNYHQKIQVTIDSPDADDLIHMTPLELKEADEMGQSLHDKAAEFIRHKEVVCFIKSYIKECKDEKVRKYHVSKVYTQREVEDHNNNQQDVATQAEAYVSTGHFKTQESYAKRKVNVATTSMTETSKEKTKTYQASSSKKTAAKETK